LRGAFRLPCEKGTLSVFFTLAPTMPPKVQRLDFAVIPNLPRAAQKSVEALGSAIGTNDATAAPVAGGQLYALRLEYGSCRFAETVTWNGSNRATVRFDCDRGSLMAHLDLERDGKIANVKFSRPDEQACAPR
jgi:hypothetical protein